jgi:hypothetical protein
MNRTRTAHEQLAMREHEPVAARSAYRSRIAHKLLAVRKP